MTQDDVGIIKHPLHLEGSIRAAAHIIALKTNPNPKIHLVINEVCSLSKSYLYIFHLKKY